MPIRVFRVVSVQCGPRQLRHNGRGPGRTWLVGVMILGTIVASGRPASAVEFTVDAAAYLVDEADAAPGDGQCASASGLCTLRAAIQETNALAGPDTVRLPGLTFPILIEGEDDTCAQGDLDISDDLELVGATTGTSIIDAGLRDRALDVIGPAIVSVTRVGIRNGVAKFGDGGGIRTDGDLELSNLSIRTSQTLSGQGGAIHNFGTGKLHLVDVTLSANQVPLNGGGLSNAGQAVLLERVTISSNIATGNGGGIANLAAAGPIDLENVTISGNSASGQGGGIYQAGTGDVTLTNVTVANNNTGGGIRNQTSMELQNTILAGNAPANCVGNAPQSLGSNLDSGFSCFLSAGGDLSNVNPLLGPLTFNGGPTLTQTLLAGSPAIDAGDNEACPATDQRGYGRPYDGNNDGTARCDMGAVEVQPSPTPTPTGTRTPSVTETPTPAPSPTVTPTSPPTSTSTATRTTTTTPTPTNTVPTPTASLTATSTATATVTPTPGRPAVHVGTAAGHPGDRVRFAVTFTSDGVDVVGVQLDIGFDAERVPIATTVTGEPDCTLNAELGKAAIFTFLPVGCSGTECVAFQAAVFAIPLPPIEPFPDGVTLFTCDAEIGAETEPGEYALSVSNVVMSDPDANALPGATGTDGAIEVVPAPTATPTDTPTGTPTDTPTGTPTETPTSTPTITPTDTPTPTFTRTSTRTRTPTQTAPPTPTATLTPTDTPSPTVTDTATPTASATRTPTASCVGDCDGNGRVDGADLANMASVALAPEPSAVCGVDDAALAVDAIVRAVNNAVGVCPSAAVRKYAHGS